MSIVATKKKTLQNAIAETHAKLFFSFASFTFGLLRLDSDIIALCLSHIHCCTDMSCTSFDCNRKSTNNSSAHSCKAFTQTNTQFVFFGKCTEKSAHRFSVSFFSWIWTLELVSRRFFFHSHFFVNCSWFPLWHLAKWKKNQFVRLEPNKYLSKSAIANLTFWRETERNFLWKQFFYLSLLCLWTATVLFNVGFLLDPLILFFLPFFSIHRSITLQTC